MRSANQVVQENSRIDHGFDCKTPRIPTCRGTDIVKLENGSVLMKHSRAKIMLVFCQHGCMHYRLHAQNFQNGGGLKASAVLSTARFHKLGTGWSIEGREGLSFSDVL